MHVRKIALLALAVAAVSCQPQAEASAPLSQEDVEAIREFAESYREAALAQDFETLTTLFTPGGVRNPPKAAPVEATASSLQAAYGGVTELRNAPDRIEAILRKQEDGRWLMSYLIFNSDRPLPQAQPENEQ